MIAAPASSSGKTTLTCALLRLLQNHKKSPVAFKCGPDFIDPMFHERVLGIKSENLDSFFCTHGQVRSIFKRNFLESKADCAVIEGVMGLFDGLAGKSIHASSYEIAKITKTPVLLVLDCTGFSRSLVALVKGFLDYDKANSDCKENLIKGVFLNKASKSQFALLKPQIEGECDVKVVGYLPKNTENVWQSRHLGLILPSEIAGLQDEIEATANLLSETLDFSAFEDLMNGEREGQFSDNKGNLCEKPSFQAASEFASTVPAQSGFSQSPVIAVARDEAFCFYYRENLRMLEEAGARIKYFSPLHDSCIPSDAAGLLLGGGYPELHALKLQENDAMRSSIKSAVKNGISVMAECGGFMYLQEKLISQEGSNEMCGVLEGECRYTGKLVRFGYAEFSSNPHVSNECGKFTVRGHEFHYFDSTNNGTAFTAKKPLSERSWPCMIQTEKLLAGFPHLYYRSCPELVEHFVKSCNRG